MLLQSTILVYDPRAPAIDNTINAVFCSWVKTLHVTHLLHGGLDFLLDNYLLWICTDISLFTG
jgi:hypothetical protein